MAGPNVPAKASSPVVPPLANLPIVDIKTGTLNPVGLGLIQQIWAAIAGSGGAAETIGFLVALAEAPPFSYSSPAEDSLPYRLAPLQVPQDVRPEGYVPFLPADPVAQAKPYTPTITYATPGDLSVSYAAQQGEYQLVNGLVCFNTLVTFTPTFTTAAGVLRISAPVVAGPQITSAALSVDPGNVTWPAARTMIAATIANGTQYFTLNGLGSGVAASALGAANYVSGVAYTISVSGCYFRL